MISLKDRLRISLALSPALLILHLWILANSSGYFFQIYGMVKSVALAASSSLLEAYIVVTTVAFAIQIWTKSHK